MLLLDGLRDIRIAWRQLGRRPGLTTMAILALGCSLGAIVTVFSLLNAVVLRPLPVARPGELVWLRDPGFSFPIFREVQARGEMFAGLFAWERRILRVAWSDEPVETPGLAASGGLHDVLGLAPAVGRLLREADVGASASEAQAVAVLSHDAWRRRFAGDPRVVGQTIRIEGHPFTIVGVTPPGFFGVAVGSAPEVTIPITMLPRLRADERELLDQPGRAWLHIMGRLGPGRSRVEADAAFQAVWRRVLEAVTPAELPAERRARFLSRQTALMDGTRGFSPVRNQFRTSLWLLFVLVAVLVAIACATVANLLLALTAERRSELAVRLAIGATYGRLVRQLLLEGLVLAAAGGAAGLLFAAWSGAMLLELASTSRVPILVERLIDWRVLAFTAGAVVVAAIAFTLAPVAGAVRIDPGPQLQQARPATTRTGGLIARTLVALQVALAVVLVGGAALFVRDLWSLLSRDAGFDRAPLLVVSVDRAGQAASRPSASPRLDVETYYGALLERLTRVPGVASASLSWVPPVSNELGAWTQAIGIDGAEPIDDGKGECYFNAVSPGFFRTVGTPLLLGRDFTWSDRQGTPAVVIVNESLARDAFGPVSPLGRSLSIGRDPSRQRLVIIGVVGDAAYRRLQDERPRSAYLPYLQLREFVEGNNLVAEVRASVSPRSLIPAVGAAVRALDPAVPVRIETVEARIADSLARERLVALMAGFLGAVALLLACGALAGLMSHHVASRTREIGLRMALGADRRIVQVAVVREALALAAIGGAAGLLLVWWSGRLVAGFLHSTTPRDPVALGAAMLAIGASAAVAAYLPARRASRIDPMVALRTD